MFELGQHGLLSVDRGTLANQETFGQVFLVESFKHIFSYKKGQAKKIIAHTHTHTTSILLRIYNDLHSLLVLMEAKTSLDLNMLSLTLSLYLLPTLQPPL